jgi:hypothetical protein
MRERFGAQVNRKAQMNLCDYQILEYTTSELQTHGVPFVVIVRLHKPSSYALQAFVLHHWKAKLGVTSRREANEIETFLEDLRLQIGEEDSMAPLFQRLSNLNIGPVRAFVSGSCSVQDLDEVVREFFDSVGGSPSWREQFDALA